MSYAPARVRSTAVEYHQSTTRVLDRLVSTHGVLRGTHGGYPRCTHGVIQGLEWSGCAACTALSYAPARVRSTAVEYHQSTTRVLDRQVSTHIQVRTWPGFPAKPSSPACPHGRLVLGGYSRGTHTGVHTWPGVPARPSSPGLPARPRRPRAPSAPGRPWSPSAPFCPAHSRLAQQSPLTAAAHALRPGSHLRQRHSHFHPIPSYSRIPTYGRYEGCRRSVLGALMRYSVYSRWGTSGRCGQRGRGGGVGAFRSGR